MKIPGVFQGKRHSAALVAKNIFLQHGNKNLKQLPINADIRIVSMP